MYEKLSDIKIKYDSIYGGIFLLFLISLYVLSPYRVIFEVIYIIAFGMYFITKKKRLTLFFFWNIFFIALCGLSFFWSNNTSQTLIETRIMIEGAIVANLLIGFLDKKEKFIMVYKFFVISGGTLILKLLTIFPITTWLNGRLGSNELGFNSNKIGIYMTISGICAFYLAKYYKKSLYYIPFFSFSIVSLLTGSRKALFLLLLGALGVIYFNSNGWTKKIKFFITTILLMVFLYFLIMDIPILYNIIGYRVESLLELIIGNTSGDYSSNVRESMIEAGLLLFKKKPLFGYGIGSYSSLTTFGVYSHNNYIELLVGLGIVGVIVYYSMYFFIIVNLFRIRKKGFITPLLTLMIIFPILEYGLVSYNGAVYQVVLSLSFASYSLLNNYKRK